MRIAPVAAAIVLATSSTVAIADSESAEATIKAKPSIEMSIEQLVADERSKAVLEKHLPGISEHSSYNQFKAMTLVQLQPWSGGMITDEGIAKIKADLAAIGQAQPADAG